MDVSRVVTLQLRVSDCIVLGACIQQVVLQLSDEAFIADLQRLAEEIRQQAREQPD